jgi:hypothetical protein
VTSIDNALAEVGSLAEGVRAWFGAVVSNNDAALREARIVGLEDQVAALAQRLARLEAELAAEGKTPDRSDPISREQTFSEFAKDVVAARSVEKREALVNSAAAQHDPRRGSGTVRAYWYVVVRDLPEPLILLLRLLQHHGALLLASSGAVRLVEAGVDAGPQLNVPIDEGLALYEAALQSSERRDRLALLRREDNDMRVVTVRLLERAEVVLNYINS